MADIIDASTTNPEDSSPEGSSRGRARKVQPPAPDATTATADPRTSAGDTSRAKQREIPGNFPYTSTPGKFRACLDNIISAERPDTVTREYIETYLGVTGGSASPIPNLLKRVGFISSDGKPTETYARFQSESGRPGAALDGLRKGYPELFQKQKFVYAHSEDQVKDLLVEITGLKKADPILRQIYGTFDALRHFVPSKFIGSDNQIDGEVNNEKPEVAPPRSSDIGPIGLSYHINIVLPETKEIAVFNAIFQSLRDNLLRP